MKIKANAHLQAHLQLFFSGRNIFMAAKELASFQPNEKLFFKISFPSENFKNAYAHPNDRQQCNLTMTAKLNTNNGCKTRTTRTPACNSGFKKLAVQWLNQVQFFNQTFLQVDSFVLRNRQLLKPANRYASL